MLFTHTAKCLEEWKAVSDRNVIARFFSSYVATTVVVCCTTTNGAVKDVKEAFYDQSQATVRDVKRHDLLIVGWDFNAKVGSDNSRREKVIVRIGLGLMNKNCMLFADFCVEHELVIGGTQFQHKPVHTYTWQSLDGRTRSQVDHTAVSWKWAASLQDVRMKRGADVGSDHKLVVMKVKLSLKAKPKIEVRKNVGMLKRSEIAKELKLKLYNSYEVLEDTEVEDVNSY